MLIDLRLKGRKVVIFGGGVVGERKARKFLQENARVFVLSKKFTKGLEELGRRGNVELVERDLKSDSPSVSSLIMDADIVVAATDDKKLNESIVSEARKRRILVSAVDEPSLSDFYLPATKRLGGIKIAVCTEGRSPAMAAILRKRLGRHVTREDILQVELQQYARTLAKGLIPDREVRRNLLYRTIQNPEIKHLLEEGKLEEAKNLVKQIIEHR